MPLQKVILIRTAATELDLQGRITGRLDVPLSQEGRLQAQQTAERLQWETVQAIYRAPCQAADQTATPWANALGVRPKVETDLANIDFGLWHGKRVADLKKQMPTTYRCWTEHPEYLAPPEGETIVSAVARVKNLLERLRKRHSGQALGLVAPPPIASIIASLINAEELNCRWCRWPADAGWIVLEEPVANPPSLQVAPA